MNTNIHLFFKRSASPLLTDQRLIDIGNSLSTAIFFLSGALDAEESPDDALALTAQGLQLLHETLPTLTTFSETHADDTTYQFLEFAGVTIGASLLAQGYESFNRTGDNAVIVSAQKLLNPLLYKEGIQMVQTEWPVVNQYLTNRFNTLVANWTEASATIPGAEHFLKAAFESSPYLLKRDELKLFKETVSTTWFQLENGSPLFQAALSHLDQGKIDQAISVMTLPEDPESSDASSPDENPLPIMLVHGQDHQSKSSVVLGNRCIRTLPETSKSFREAVEAVSSNDIWNKIHGIIKGKVTAKDPSLRGLAALQIIDIVESISSAETMPTCTVSIAMCAELHPILIAPALTILSQDAHPFNADDFEDLLSRVEDLPAPLLASFKEELNTLSREREENLDIDAPYKFCFILAIQHYFDTYDEDNVLLNALISDIFDVDVTQCNMTQDLFDAADKTTPPEDCGDYDQVDAYVTSLTSSKLYMKTQQLDPLRRQLTNAILTDPFFSGDPPLDNSDFIGAVHNYITAFMLSFAFQPLPITCHWMLDHGNIAVFTMHHTDSGPGTLCFDINRLYPNESNLQEWAEEQFAYRPSSVEDIKRTVASDHCEGLVLNEREGVFERAAWDQQPINSAGDNGPSIWRCNSLRINYCKAYQAYHQRHPDSEEEWANLQTLWTELRAYRKEHPDHELARLLDVLFQHTIRLLDESRFPLSDDDTLSPDTFAPCTAQMLTIMAQGAQHLNDVDVLKSAYFGIMSKHDTCGTQALAQLPHPLAACSNFVCSIDNIEVGMMFIDNSRLSPEDKQLSRVSYLTYVLHTMSLYPDTPDEIIQYAKDQLIETLTEDLSRTPVAQKNMRDLYLRSWMIYENAFKDDDTSFELISDTMSYVDIQYENTSVGTRYVYDVPDDGDCFFHAWSLGLRCIDEAQIPPELLSIKDNPTALRTYTASLMLAVVEQGQTPWDPEAAKPPEQHVLAKCQPDTGLITGSLISEIADTLDRWLRGPTVHEITHPHLMLECEACFAPLRHLSFSFYDDARHFDEKGSLRPGVLQRLLPDSDMLEFMGEALKKELEDMRATYIACKDEPGSEMILPDCHPIKALTSTFSSNAFNPETATHPCMQRFTKAHARDIGITHAHYSGHVIAKTEEWFSDNSHTLSLDHEMCLGAFVDFICKNLHPPGIETPALHAMFIRMMSRGYKDPDTKKTLTTINKKQALHFVSGLIRSNWASQPELTLLSQLFHLDTCLPSSNYSILHCGQSLHYEGTEAAAASLAKPGHVTVIHNKNHYMALLPTRLTHTPAVDHKEHAMESESATADLCSPSAPASKAEIRSPKRQKLDPVDREGLLNIADI